MDGMMDAAVQMGIQTLVIPYIISMGVCWTCGAAVGAGCMALLVHLAARMSAR